MKIFQINFQSQRNLFLHSTKQTDMSHKLIQVYNKKYKKSNGTLIDDFY